MDDVKRDPSQPIAGPPGHGDDAPAPGRPQHEHKPRGPLSKAFGVVLLVAWVAATIIWVASTIHLASHGNAMAVVTAIIALALFVLLGGMEGLEVSVIDRWEKLWPGGSPSVLAGWLAARQLFVALIVTSATLLANRKVLIIPGTSARITGGVAIGAFDTVWVGLTVLWYAQIFPKQLGAINPDRYLRLLRPLLFPVVYAVYRMGVSQPGEWLASAVEHRLDWSDEPAEAATKPPPHGLSHAAIWRALVPHRHRSGPGRRRRHTGP
jgi:hypothetical protein